MKPIPKQDGNPLGASIAVLSPTYGLTADLSAAWLTWP